MNKLTLIINSKKGGYDKKTAAIPRRRIRRLGRRRRNRGIRFYDLGYRKVSEGVYQTIPYLDPYRTAPLNAGNYGRPTDDLDNIKEVDATRVQALIDLIYEVPIEEWASEYALYDGVYLDRDEVDSVVQINWRGAGLDSLFGPPPEETFKDGNYFPGEPVDGTLVMQHSGPFWYQFDTSTHKVTAELDYAADAVPLLPTKGMDVFMLPALTRVNAHLEHVENYLAPSETGHVDRMGFFQIVFPRESELDPTYDYYGLRHYEFNMLGGHVHTSTVLELTNSITSTDYAFMDKGWRFIQAEHPHFAEEAVIDSGGTWIPTGKDPDDCYPTAYYPLYPSLPPSSPTSTSAMFGLSLRQRMIGQLICVIKSAGQYYYIWSNDAVHSV